MLKSEYKPCAFFSFPSRLCVPGVPLLSAELLGQTDENSFGSANVAEPIRVLVLYYFSNELRAVPAEPGYHLVDVFNKEHDAKITE